MQPLHAMMEIIYMKIMRGALTETNVLLATQTVKLVLLSPPTVFHATPTYISKRLRKTGIRFVTSVFIAESQTVSNVRTTLSSAPSVIILIS